MSTDCQIEKIGKHLNDPTKPLAERFRSLFTLRNLGGDDAVKQISECFVDPSALLKHELAYCLGQMGNKNAIPVLKKVLEDEEQEPMVRHEAGEALGAIGDSSVISLLEKYSSDPCIEVAETCEIALARVKWVQEQSKEGKYINTDKTFTSVDPTPPSNLTDVSVLKEQLCNESLKLYDRYKAMFALRNINTAESAKALACGFSCSSALFRHEIGFVLGQMACDCVVEELAAVVRNTQENDMVRHEAAEALGSIATEEAEIVLKEFLSDKAAVVRESCEVALNISEYNNSSEFQYADGLVRVSNENM